MLFESLKYGADIRKVNSLKENRISDFQRGDVVEGAVDRARVGVPPHLPPRGLAVRRGPTAGQAQEVVQGRK